MKKFGIYGSTTAVRFWNADYAEINGEMVVLYVRNADHKVYLIDEVIAVICLEKGQSIEVVK